MEEKRELPILDINDNLYRIDIRNAILISDCKGVPSIPFSAFECDMGDFSYWGFYDLEKKDVFCFTKELTTMPGDHVIAVYFPADHDTDPVTYAEIYARDFYVDKDNIPTRIEACCLPLAESFLPEMILENIARIEKEQKSAGIAKATEVKEDKQKPKRNSRKI